MAPAEDLPGTWEAPGSGDAPSAGGAPCTCCAPGSDCAPRSPKVGFRLPLVYAAEALKIAPLPLPFASIGHGGPWVATLTGPSPYSRLQS